jgi:hypothetical protein
LFWYLDGSFAVRSALKPRSRKVTSAFHPLDLLEISLKRNGPSPEVVNAVVGRGFTTAAEFLGLRWLWWNLIQEDLLEAVPGLKKWPSLQLFLSCAADWPMASDPGVVKISTNSTPRRRIGACELPTDVNEWGKEGPFADLERQFHDGLVEGGVPKKLALAFVGAFSEMASNAVDHASSPVRPIASFEVTNRSWAFGVTDVGRGALGSLRDNPAFASLEHESDALQAIMREGVSRTGEPGRGRGFAEVFKALADNQSRLRFRSGGAVAFWRGQSPTAQEIAIDVLPLSRTGFHVGVAGPLPRPRER